MVTDTTATKSINYCVLSLEIITLPMELAKLIDSVMVRQFLDEYLQIKAIIVRSFIQIDTLIIVLCKTILKVW